MNCQACRKPVKPHALTCSAKCRNAKKRVTAWLARVATEYEFSNHELDQLARFAYQHGVKLGKLVSRALDAAKERQAVWGGACLWCGDSTDGQGERVTCSAACRVSISRLRAKKGERADNWHRWLYDGLEAKEWLRKRAERAWGTIQAIEWRYDYDIALAAALFCYENKGEEKGTFYISW